MKSHSALLARIFWTSFARNGGSVQSRICHAANSRARGETPFSEWNSEAGRFEKQVNARQPEK